MTKLEATFAYTVVAILAIPYALLFPFVYVTALIAGFIKYLSIKRARDADRQKGLS